MEKRSEVIGEILKKLSFLSNQHLGEILERANELIEDDDPKASLTKSREALERIVYDVYIREMKEEPKKVELGFMLNNNQFTRKIDTRIQKYMNIVRDMGNMGPHSVQGPVEEKDAVRVLDCLADIINWYIERYCNSIDWDGDFGKTDRGMESEAEKEYQLGEEAKQKGEFITTLVHYSNAAELGHTEAQYQLAMAFKEGLGIHQNLEEAYKWFEKASEAGHKNALFEVGSYYYYRTDEKKDNKKAFEYLTKAAKEGHPDAQIILGKMYQVGDGTDVNIFKSIHWFNEAAEKNNRAEAYLYLGQIYEEGKLIIQDEKKAFQKYWIATNQDNVEAMFRLGIMCLEGRGTEANLEQALYMLEKAAEHGHEEALEWYQKAASQNNEFPNHREKVEQPFEGIADSDGSSNRTDSFTQPEDQSIPTNDPKQEAKRAEIYRKAAAEVNAKTKYKNSKDILEDVLATFAVLIEEHLDDIDPFRIVWESESSEFFNNDQEKFGLVMIDYHLFYGVEIDYDPYTEFELFPTLNHAYTHVASKVLTKNGYDPNTLKPIGKKTGFFKSLFT